MEGNMCTGNMCIYFIKTKMIDFYTEWTVFLKLPPKRNFPSICPE